MAYTAVAKIAHIKLMLHKVLPAVYDESLSYLEGLAKLTYKVNECITDVNALNDNVSLLNDAVIELNGRVEAVEGEIDGFEKEVERRFEELTNQIYSDVDAKLTEVDDKIVDVENRVSALETKVDTTLEEFRVYIESEMSRVIEELTSVVNLALSELDARFEAFSKEMREYIEDQINEALKKIPEITSVMVVDPTTGKLTPIQECVNHIVDYASYYALTVDEWNKLGLTVDEMNHLMVKSLPIGFSCWQWMHEAKKLLIPQLSPALAEMFANYKDIVRDYLTGEKVWHPRNVDINWLIWATTGTYSCGDLEEMDFTIDEWNAVGMTVSEWNMKGNIMLVHTEP